LKIVKSPHLNEKSPDFDIIWYTTANLELDDSQMTKYEKFQNSRWRTTAILKFGFDHISAADCPISAKNTCSFNLSKSKQTQQCRLPVTNE